MADAQILGVDFSGARGDEDIGNTWVANGKIAGQTLTIGSCSATSRAGLKNLLTELVPGSVAAMDFPFGVPKEFLDFQKCEAQNMTDAWKRFASTSPEDFWAAAGRLRETRRRANQEPVELRREGDALHYSEAISPLNIRMYRMTLRGMQLLHRLGAWDESRWSVPPLNTPSDSSVCLLEAMPGAFLRSVGFEWALIKRYKIKKSATAADQRMRKENREKILAGLKDQYVAGLSLQMGPGAPDQCTFINDDNALDSLVAAVAAASWVSERPFLGPEADELDAAKLEGWIYAPTVPLSR